jgi:HEAT repeat protein
MEGLDTLAGLAQAGLRRLARLAARLGLAPEVSESQRGRWREAARAAGVVALQESADGLAGWAGPLRVRLSRYSDSESRGTRITVSGPAMPAGLTVRPEGLVSAVRGVRGVREIEIGHDTFDAAAWVEGNATVARAVLDAATRRAIRALFSGRLERTGRTPFWASGCLENGVLRVDVPRAAPSAGPRLADDREPGVEPGAYVYLGGLEHLAEVLAEVISLARRLATPEDMARRLADNLKTEMVAPVRLQCLATLAREFADHPATGEALLAAREDPDAEVRLRAGVALGPKGRDVLLGIAMGEGAEDATSERAVLALGFHLTTEAARGILSNALRTRREATARACLFALARRRDAESIATLAKVLAVEKQGLAMAAAEALGDTADASAEAPLLSALGGGPSPVRLAAARALGRVGTVAAVQPLKEAEARDGGMRAAARQAIAEIQARLQGAEPGQLSLAGGEAGALSLADGEAGRLSLPADPLGPGETEVPRDDRVTE